MGVQNESPMFQPFVIAAMGVEMGNTSGRSHVRVSSRKLLPVGAVNQLIHSMVGVFCKHLLAPTI